MSMEGAPIQAVNTALASFGGVLREDFHTRETAHISVITFDARAVQVVPLTEVDAFYPPILEAKGHSTHYGKALELLGQAQLREFQMRTAEFAGDWRPFSFFFSDGAPLDRDWRVGLAAYKSAVEKLKGKMFAIGCGPKADFDVLSEIGDQTIQVEGLRPELIESVFEWVSQSIKKVCRSASLSDASASGSIEVIFERDELPEGVTFRF
jgi:uncharacterized protein YegL